MPGCPDIWFGAVDVRDVVDLHLKAMTDPAARGERFLATGGGFRDRVLSDFGCIIAAHWPRLLVRF
jgi:nucleoside-diphosphate-sugar epimerase